ncbi:unnamed protein product [Didymodactylos carnosus]|uniref:Uncharacterized protein n=1 Tax=Didymodactylos carnosus TaxID=1234261 RepID=A0A813SZD5_9BILA|nr:unnamed protein product [Didymodactylos carnosus]CAF3589226.1 unnamed protein product [Didymodactylos carnosus]
MFKRVLVDQRPDISYKNQSYDDLKNLLIQHDCNSIFLDLTDEQCVFYNVPIIVPYVFNFQSLKHSIKTFNEVSLHKYSMFEIETFIKEKDIIDTGEHETVQTPLRPKTKKKRKNKQQQQEAKSTTSETDEQSNATPEQKINFKETIITCHDINKRFDNIEQEFNLNSVQSATRPDDTNYYDDEDNNDDNSTKIENDSVPWNLDPFQKYLLEQLKEIRKELVGVKKDLVVVKKTLKNSDFKCDLMYVR